MKWVGGWGDADSISQVGVVRNMAEEGGDSWAPLMEEMTELLGITDWDSYVQMKAKYNPTQY